LADIDVTFGADGSQLKNVIGGLSKELINFAKQSQSTFGSVEGSITSASQATIKYNKELRAQEAALKSIKAASSIKTPGTSSSGFDDKEIKAVQAGLADSTTQARLLSQELSNMSRTSISDENIRKIQAGLSESTRQASLLSSEVSRTNTAEQASVGFLAQQVAQYHKLMQSQNEINNILDKRLSKSKEIELATKPQSANTSSQIGLNPDQVRQVQVALAQSTEQARQLREEFLKQNEALGKSKELVKFVGKDLVKAFDPKVVQGTGKEIGKIGQEVVLYNKNIRQGPEYWKATVVGAKKAAETTAKTAKAAKDFSSVGERLKSVWNSLGNESLAGLRYAMYDISNTASRISKAAAALALAPIGFSIQYEREFANVVRTNEIASNSMKTTRENLQRDLKAIAQTTPISWADVTNIATLAGQLGVATAVIGDFTETVAKFSATTDLSVDAAATAFGRLDQLIDGIDGDFNALGSAILAVGVDSVATESQIVAISTNIASMGNLAGLAAPEIIGLSGAMASLGIRPELARGNITRLFSNIGKSAVEGGFNVAEYGRLTSRTADQFVSDWQTRPGAVIQDFFDGINKEGPEAERTLRQLGITSVRDIPALLRLAQNSDEVRRLIALSSAEYLYGTKVTEQYGIISGTTAEQLKRLAQNAQTLQASIGDSVGPLSAQVALLNTVVEGFTAISDTAVGQVINGIVIAVLLLVSGFAALIAASAGTVASMLALKFVTTKLGIELNANFVKALFGSKVAMDSVTAASTRTAGAVALLNSVIKKFFVIGLIVTAVAALTAVVGYFVGRTEDASEKVERFFGSAEGLSDAINEDTKAFDKNTGKMKDGSDALRVYTREVDKLAESQMDNVLNAEAYVAPMLSTADAMDDASDAGKGLEKSADGVADAQNKLADATRNANDATGAQEEIFAAGSLTLDYFKEGMLQQVDLVNIFGDPALVAQFEAAGGNLGAILAAGMVGESDAAIDLVVANLQKNVDAARAAERAANKYQYGQITAEEYAAREANNQALEDALALQSAVNGELRDYAEASGLAIDELDEATLSTNTFTDALGLNGAASALADEDLTLLLNGLFEMPNFINSVESSLDSFGKSLAETGGDASDAAGEIQGVIRSITSAPGNDTNTILGNLSGLLQLLEGLELQGYDTAASQLLVRSAIEGAGDMADIKATDMVAYAGSVALVEGALGNFNVSDFMASMVDVTKGTGGAAAKVETLTEKFDKLFDSMFEVINLGRDTEEAIFSLGEAFGENGDEALYASDEMQDAIGSILAQSGSAEEGVANLATLFSGLAKTVGGESAPALQILRQAISQVAAQFGISEAQAQQFIDTAGGGISTINFDNFNRGIQNAQQEVRTLLDYASDLESVFGRAFDIRFANTFAIDNIAEAWFKLGQNVEDARREVDDLIASQQDLGADRALKEYFLSVANAYGDTLRAAQLRQEIADLDREQADNAIELDRSRALAGGDLTGQGEGERQNRAALLGLVGDYQSYIGTLAESGASQDELRKATERARKEFIAQALELGYQEDVVLEYAKAFDDVRTAIDNVPRNITVDANVNPALQALNELNASLQTQIRAANDLNRALNQPVATPSGGGGKVEETKVIPVVVGGITLVGTPGAAERAFRQAQADIPRGRFISPRTIDRGFSDGGFTGRGGAMDPAGIVHKGEYVVPQKYVNQSTGMPDPNFLAQLQNGMRGYQMGGFVGGGNGMGDGTMMVELSPYDRKLLSDAGNVQLRLNGKVVAEATNANNFNEARRGSN